jgi:hypothetical protein
MKPFDMSTTPRTSMKFIRALCDQSRAAGRADEITHEDAQVILGCYGALNGFAAPNPPQLPQEDKL